MEAISVVLALSVGSLIGVGISAAGLKMLLSLMPSRHAPKRVADRQRA